MKIVRNVLAVILGFFIGSSVNMGIIMYGPSIITLPEVIDPSDMDSLVANMHLFEPKHFITPFLAHALGTLLGALLAALISANNHFKFSMGIAIFFLFGGIYSAYLLPAPEWFIIVDLLVAYLPMGYLGWKLGSGK